jgi:hypothetical protein
MTLVKLGIVRIGQLYVCDRRFKLDNLHRQIVVYSENITDAALYKERVACEVAEKYGGHMIPITLNIPEANA